MRNLWVRIGLGAAAVFAAGMFFVVLGHQVKSSVSTAIRDGGRISIPLSLLPFHVDQDKVGSISEIAVRRDAPAGAKHIRVVVRVNDPAAATRYADCLFQVDSGHDQGFFACIHADTPEAADLVRIGELTMEPSGVSRPVVISRLNARGWFGENSDGQFSLKATEQGASINVSDSNGANVLQLSADSNGAVLYVRDKSGKEVVNLQATKAGVKIDVKQQ
jgi:hypothetical protein